jgi:hypothetical protein
MPQLAYFQSKGMTPWLKGRLGMIGGSPNSACEFSVTYLGNCYPATTVNYLQWGWMNRLCFDDSILNYVTLPPFNPWWVWNAQIKVSLWKFWQYDQVSDNEYVQEALNFTSFGFWYPSPGALVPPAVLGRTCNTIGVPVCSHNIFDWVWEPNRPRSAVLRRLGF